MVKALLSDPIQFVYFVVALLAALTVHEASHAWIAYSLGDPTAKLLGRISLNPLKHLDPLGTLMILMSSWFGFGFGWGKPVPVNPGNLRPSPKVGMALVAAAGPGSNLVLAAIVSQIIRFGPISAPWLLQLLSTVVLISVVLTVFNLIPIPPLDGFRVLVGILPNGPAYALARLEQYGPAILLVVVFFGGGLLNGYMRLVGGPILRVLGM